MGKTLIPNDFRDTLSILSLLGFIAIFSTYVLNNQFLSNNMNQLFLIIGGVGMLIAGKVVDIKNWAKDGIQKNEYTQILALVTGISSIVLGILLFTSITLPERVTGWIGFIALIPAIFIFMDYIKKNTK